MLLSKIHTPKAVFLNQQKQKTLAIIIEENISITDLINVKIIIKIYKIYLNKYKIKIYSYLFKLNILFK